MDEDDLREICLKELPLAFYKGMVDGISGVYKEAEGLAFKTPSWGSEQANYILPHFRLILFENLLKTTAESCGIYAVPTDNISKNYSYTLVRSNRLVITSSAVEGRQELPRKSVFRNQLCSMNDFLNRPTLTNLYAVSDVFNPAGLYAPNEIYCIILHGKSYKKTADGKWITDAGKYGFLRLAFLNESMTEYAANFDFFELYTQALARLDSTHRTLDDRAIPKLKDRDDQGDRKENKQ